MEEQVQLKKPFVLKIVSVVALTYNLVFLTIYLFGIVFNKFFTLALTNYFPREIGQHEILIFSIFGATLYIISIIGLLYIRKLKRIGLILFITSIIAYFTTKAIIWDISYINLIINLLFICVFASYFKQFR
ncbi:MAG: hypothetical protein CVU00_00685 [Bacteroidetes bacterium HGW-Bacteroidetes-17]|jgi:hypothetical protein|nr:MAG: hypothetical protein CVU00_00685 [Bacteroidetes bacterium HGW-Bacteroidetes-17]